MKIFYMVCEVEENGKFYAYAMRVTSNDNIIPLLKRENNLMSATLCETKKRAYELVDLYNTCYKANHKYMFDAIGF